MSSEYPDPILGRHAFPLTSEPEFLICLGSCCENFQRNSGLIPTGTIDAPTLTVMVGWFRLSARTGQPSPYPRFSSVECEGYNSETGSYVYGECIGSSFEGYDSETGGYVYGDCGPAMDLDAYDSETGAYVYGECGQR